VQAHWHDVETGEQMTETAGSAATAKVLRHQYPTQEEAASAAAAEWRGLNRALSKLTVNLAKGDAGLLPEMPVTVVGFKPQIDGTDWVMERVVHSLNDSGFTTRCEMEVKG
jgi:phage protein D